MNTLRSISAIFFLSISAIAQHSAPWTFGDEAVFGGAAPAVALTCSASPWFEHTDASSGSEGVGSDVNVDRYWSGSWITATNGGTICSVSMMWGLGGGDVSGITYYYEVYSKSGDNLGTKLGESAGFLGTNSWSQTWVKMDLSSGVVVTNGQQVAVVGTRRGGDAINYALHYYGPKTGYVSARWKQDKTLFTSNSGTCRPTRVYFLQ